MGYANVENSPMRPGHIHWMVTKEGYGTLITQIYDRLDKYTIDDSVFAVKDELVVDFVPCKTGEAKWELKYDIILSLDKETAKRQGLSVSKEVVEMAELV